MSKMYDPEGSLAEALTKEGGCRPNGRPALRRTDNVCLPEALTKEGGGRPNGRPALRRTNNVFLPGALTKEGGLFQRFLQSAVSGLRSGTYAG